MTTKVTTTATRPITPLQIKKVRELLGIPEDANASIYRLPKEGDICIGGYLRSVSLNPDQDYELIYTIIRTTNS